MHPENVLVRRDMFAVISVSLVVKVLGENKITQARRRREEARALTLRYPNSFRQAEGEDQQRVWKSEDGHNGVVRARSRDRFWKEGVLCGTVPAGQGQGGQRNAQTSRDGKAVFPEGWSSRPEQMQVTEAGTGG